MNFQMEPARADTPEALPIVPVDTITRMMLLGLLERVELIEKHPYEVALIDRWAMTSSRCMIKLRFLDFLKYREAAMRRLLPFV